MTHWESVLTLSLHSDNEYLQLLCLVEASLPLSGLEANMLTLLFQKCKNFSSQLQIVFCFSLLPSPLELPPAGFLQSISRNIAFTLTQNNIFGCDNKLGSVGIEACSFVQGDIMGAIHNEEKSNCYAAFLY